MTKKYYVDHNYNVLLVETDWIERGCNVMVKYKIKEWNKEYTCKTGVWKYWVFDNKKDVLEHLISSRENMEKELINETERNKIKIEEISTNKKTILQNIKAYS